MTYMIQTPYGIDISIEEGEFLPPGALRTLAVYLSWRLVA